MRKWKGSWILLTLALALGAYTYFFEIRQKDMEAKDKESSSRLISFDPDQVNEVQVNTAKEKVVLQKTVDGWNLVSPFQDRADNEAVDAWVKTLCDEKSSDTAKEGDSLDWKAFGFSEDNPKIQLKTNGGQEVLLQISSMKNFEGNVFLKRSQENRVFVGSSSWENHGKKSAADLRDKTFFRSPSASITSLEMKTLKGLIRLAKKDNNWFSPDQPDLALDQNRVRNLINSLSGTRAVNVLTEGKADPKKWSDSPVTLSFRVQMDGKLWTGDLAQQKNKDVLAINSDPGFRYKMDGGFYASFSESNLNSFRDHRLPFQFDPKMAKKMEIQTPLKKINFNLVGETWELVESKPGQDFRQDSIKDLLLKLKTLEAGEYLSSKTPKDFKPENKILLKNEKDEVVFELGWSPLRKTKRAGIEQSETVAKTSLFNEYFTLEEFKVNQLELQNIAAPKSNPEEQKSPPITQ